nr:hypothetical protein [Mycoplasmopsis bovis]
MTLIGSDSSSSNTKPHTKIKSNKTKKEQKSKDTLNGSGFKFFFKY